jgi:ribosomal protein S18 acetylase RimI-like enzyme
MNFDKFLQENKIIDFSHPTIQKLSQELAKDCKNDEQIAKNCFIYVRDNINHSGDFKDDITTCKASDVLKYKTGWCYAKSHLLAALLRANDIPTGFCYQRLSCGEYKDDIYCLHGLNAIYLKDYGWYKVDARGNKKGVDAQFNPPFEKLAFILEKNEFDLPSIYDEPLDIVVESLNKYKTYDEMINNFPNLNEFITTAKVDDAKYLSLIAKNLETYIFDCKMPKWFEDSISIDEFKNRILDKNYKHYIYVLKNKIVGFIAIKENSRIYHLFVDKEYQGNKVAKKLWEFVKENNQFEELEVNSSLYAVKVYESFGFIVNGEIKNHNEMKFQNMKYKK